MNPDPFDRRSFLRGASTVSLVAAGVTGLGDRTASAQQSPSPFADLFYILLGGTSTMLSVLDGEVWFKGFAKSPKDTFPNYEQVLTNFRQELTVKSQTSVWRYRDEQIRAYYPREERVAGMYVPGIEGDYLAADYSTLPPRVVLTGKPNEWSRWEATPVEHARAGSTKTRDGTRHVRHLNGRRLDAWLATSKTEYIRDPVQTWSAVQPILSFDQKLHFYWRSYRPDDTSK